MNTATQKMSETSLGLPVQRLIDSHVYCLAVPQHRPELVITIDGQQASKIAPYANESWIAAPSPQARSKSHNARRAVVASLGLGLIYVDGAVATTALQAVHRDVNTDLIEQAFNAHDGSQSPAAGSAGAKRMGGDRLIWEPLRLYLHPVRPLAVRWATIRNRVPEMRQFTASAARKAIDRGECVGVKYTDGPISEFFATSKGTT